MRCNNVRSTKYAHGFIYRCTEVDKFLLTYVILKLRLIKGKCIIFVNDVDRCYRLKLFLEQFSIKSCVLNSELPLNSRYRPSTSFVLTELIMFGFRYHVVQEFNKGVYDYIIASDESIKKSEQDTNESEEEVEVADDDCRVHFCLWLFIESNITAQLPQRSEVNPTAASTVMFPRMSIISQKQARQSSGANDRRRHHRPSQSRENGSTDTRAKATRSTASRAVSTSSTSLAS